MISTFLHTKCYITVQVHKFMPHEQLNHQTFVVIDGRPIYELGLYAIHLIKSHPSLFSEPSSLPAPQPGQLPVPLSSELPWSRPRPRPVLRQHYGDGEHRVHEVGPLPDQGGEQPQLGLVKRNLTNENSKIYNTNLLKYNVNILLMIYL